MWELSVVFQLVLVPILIGVNAFFVAAEYAVVTIRTTRIEELRQEGVGVARVLARLKEDMSGSLATIQVCITATNLLIGAVAEPAMARLLFKVLQPLGFVLPVSVARWIALVIGLLVVTLFTVVLSELLPKALTLQYTEQIAVVVAKPIALFRVICHPLVRIMNWMGNGVTHALGLGRVEIEEPVHTEAELEMLVDRADDAGEFHAEHGDLLRRAFDFADLNVRHVMIPLQKVASLDANSTVGETIDILQEWPYTRWPLKDPESGRIVGIVNIKLMLHATALGIGETVILRDLAIDPTYLDPDLPLVDALADMRKSRRHLAVVKEGDVELGIVTLEDILEAIVGHIPSEMRGRDLGRR